MGKSAEFLQFMEQIFSHSPKNSVEAALSYKELVTAKTGTPPHLVRVFDEKSGEFHTENRGNQATETKR